MNKSDVRKHYQDIYKTLKIAGLHEVLKYAINEDLEFFREEIKDKSYIPLKELEHYVTLNNINVTVNYWVIDAKESLPKNCIIDGIQEEISFQVEEELEVKLSNSKGEKHHFLGQLKGRRGEIGKTCLMIKLIQRVENE
ncbi:hypothetical protein H6G33_09575 [Calothrix sp. FACHB-1219]|uniref:hypothetical protein n=1 Tax=unclassified Calothrix TaxID=2619626 RepID=UPI0016868B02|nr:MULTISPECIES: hypothetical protein [unclassified Calothrix]MBD2201596.1 hypothetical protein [Calothrix sp. FACHB-168]MBD2217282.1 hypothetical protein [Calothrix sp. FACHB-1219]